MEIIDIHTHIYPDKIARKATESVRDFYQLEGAVKMDGTVDMLLQRGAQAGINRYVVLPVSNAPNRVRSINSFILEQTALHDNSQRFPIDDPRLFPVYDAIQGKIPVLLHMGDQRYNYSHPVRLRKILGIFPKLEVIAAHFGGYSMFHTARELLWDTDCVFDISSAMMFMERGEAERYINSYGAERMAYGTDYPLWDPVTEVQRFQSLKLSGRQFDQIAHKTAERILKL